MADKGQGWENIKSLMDIIILTLALGVYPEELNEAKVILLLKKTLDQMDPYNYCPVLNFSFLGKVVEGAVA